MKPLMNFGLKMDKNEGVVFGCTDLKVLTMGRRECLWLLRKRLEVTSLNSLSSLLLLPFYVNLIHFLFFLWFCSFFKKKFFVKWFFLKKLKIFSTSFAFTLWKTRAGPFWYISYQICSTWQLSRLKLFLWSPKVIPAYHYT